MNEQQIEKLEGLPGRMGMKLSTCQNLKERQVKVEQAPDYRAHSCHKDHRQLKPWQKVPQGGDLCPGPNLSAYRVFW